MHTYIVYTVNTVLIYMCVGLCLFACLLQAYESPHVPATINVQQSSGIYIFSLNLMRMGTTITK